MTTTISQLLRDGLIDDAKATAIARLDRDPRDPESLTALAKIAMFEGDVPLAETFLARAEATGTTADTLLVRAAIAAESGDPALAIAHYREALDLEPRAEAWFGLGRVYLAHGAPAEARSALERAIALDCDGAALHYHLGVALAELGELEPAARALQRTIELCASYVPVYPALARILVALGHPEEAKDVVEVGLELAPEHPLLLGALCELAMSANELTRALELAERARTASPSEPAAIARSAAIAVALAQPERAVEILAESTGIEHAALFALEGIARAAMKKRDVAGAERAYRRAMALDPRDWRSPNDLGVLALERGATREAIAALEEAHRRAPLEMEISLNLACAHAVQGDAAAAERHASRVLSSALAADHPLRKRAKDLLRNLLAPASKRGPRREARVLEHPRR